MTHSPTLAFAPDWTATGVDPAAVHYVAFAGRFRSSRRAIDPPRIEMSPVPGAISYDIVASPLTQPDVVGTATSSEPAVDLAPMWASLPTGPIQLVGRAFGEHRAIIGVTPLRTLEKAPDWIDHTPEPADYLATGDGVIAYLCDGVPPAPAHPEDPIYMWHAALDPAGARPAIPQQYPALTYPSLIRLFLTGHRLGLRDDLIDRSVRLADFLINHPMVTEGPLAGLPMSTMGQDGRGTLYEEDRTTLVRIGWTGCTMLDLSKATGESRFAAYAHRLGEVLLATQEEDGSWPYRVRLTDAAVVEPYTAASVMALFLLERLADDDTRYADAFDRGLDWIIANPVQTGLWQQMYEDVRTLEPYDNLEQWAALETAMLLLRRNHPDALPIATALVRYVEDQFVLFGDESSLLVPYLPHTPAVLEQYHCYWPMDFHTANYVRAAVALHEATGDVVWAHKAIAAANTITRCRRPDGRLSTLVPDRRFGATPRFHDWFNCMAHAAEVLLTAGPRLTVLAGKEV